MQTIRPVRQGLVRLHTRPINQHPAIPLEPRYQLNERLPRVSGDADRELWPRVCALVAQLRPKWNKLDRWILNIDEEPLGESEGPLRPPATRRRAGQRPEACNGHRSGGRRRKGLRPRPGPEGLVQLATALETKWRQAVTRQHHKHRNRYLRTQVVHRFCCSTDPHRKAQRRLGDPPAAHPRLQDGEMLGDRRHRPQAGSHCLGFTHLEGRLPTAVWHCLDPTKTRSSSEAHNGKGPQAYISAKSADRWNHGRTGEPQDWKPQWPFEIETPITGVTHGPIGHQNPPVRRRSRKYHHGTMHLIETEPNCQAWEQFIPCRRHTTQTPQIASH